MQSLSLTECFHSVLLKGAAVCSLPKKGSREPSLNHESQLQIFVSSLSQSFINGAQVMFGLINYKLYV